MEALRGLEHSRGWRRSWGWRRDADHWRSQRAGRPPRAACPGGRQALRHMAVREAICDWRSRMATGWPTWVWSGGGDLGRGGWW